MTERPSPYSKPIEKVDEGSKYLVMEALGGYDTYGFDVDSIYYLAIDDMWIVLEFLKSEHKTVRPADSHPGRYWKRNWRKFRALWRLTQKLEGELYLVNYEDLSHAQDQGRADREFGVIRVDEMDPTEKGGITREDSRIMDFGSFQKWFRALNGRAARV